MQKHFLLFLHLGIALDAIFYKLGHEGIGSQLFIRVSRQETAELPTN